MKGVARQTVLYGIGMLAARALSFVMLPVYTRFLSPADYGIMELINMTLDVVMSVAGAQMVSGVYRFYHKTQLHVDRQRVVSTAFLLFMATFGTLGLTAALMAPHLSLLLFDTQSHVITIRVAAATMALTPTILVPQAYLRVRDEAGLFVASNMGKLAISAALNVILLIRGWGVLAIFTSALVATVLIGGSLTLRMLRQTGIRPSRSAAGDLIRYGVPLVVTNIATFLFTFGDRFFLQAAG
ncbi:MAG: lipopolysaccharide biosynthesis protein, partial [Longimicrobiales bacterium]